MTLYDINIYVTQYYIKSINEIINKYNLENDIFKNKKLIINIYKKFEYDMIQKYNIIIKMKNNYTIDILKLMLINKIYINFFKNYNILGYKNILKNNDYLYPYTFYFNNYNIDIIKNNISIYNEKFKNNKINKQFGNELWIVKDNIGARGINTNIYTFDELLTLNKNNIIIQKYLEYPYLVDNKKHDIRVHLIIIPKIIKINNKYELKYKNNKLQLHYYLHNVILGKFCYNNYDKNDKNLITHLTNQYIQGYEKYNNYIFYDNDIYDLIKKKLLKFIFQNNIQDIIYNCIDDYPYFYQIIAFDILITQDKKDIFIIDVNTNPGLSYDDILKTKLMNLTLQRVIRSIYKLKYNLKIKINNNFNYKFDKL